LYTPDRRARGFRGRLLRWYGRNGRDLPWRRTRDPYRILVSEVMLQQTQVARVLPAYARFLRRFPSLRSLGRASLGAVLLEWSGLGYPRRARDLHRAARLTKGRLPRDIASLDALPGIGAYTAGAVACFSSGAAVAFADTNVRRVLGRVLLGRTATEREAVAIDAAAMPRADAARWHHALMDLGATVCVARMPRCARCPVLDICISKGVDAAPARRRQTAFATSDRRVRGAIMRVLAARRSVALRTLRKDIADDRVPALVTKLSSEGLLVLARGRVSLPGLGQRPP
jgi:A/G-specific adenine glycosylase